MVKRKIMAMAFAFVLISQAVSAASFTDIKGHWAESTIITIADKGVVNGVTNTQFVPDGEVTRAQYLKMIMEATGLKTVPVRRGECLDANNGQWYGPYLQSALDAGLIPEPMVAGYKEEVKYELDENGNAISSKVIYSGAFNGELPITREEMAVLTQYVYQYTRTILTNKPVTENKKKGFDDADNISDWAKTSVVQAVANGFMDGMDNNLFNPTYTATRAQAATVILRVINKIGE